MAAVTLLKLFNPLVTFEDKNAKSSLSHCPFPVTTATNVYTNDGDADYFLLITLMK